LDGLEGTAIPSKARIAPRSGHYHIQNYPIMVAVNGLVQAFTIISGDLEHEAVLGEAL
jgi:hypothetical protein